MEPVAVCFDADCGFCRWAADVLRSWDRRHRLRFVAIQTEEGARLLRPVDPDGRLDAWHAVGPDCRVWSAGDAVPVVLRELPLGRPLAAVATSAPGTTDLLYRWVSRHRGRLGRLIGTERCRVDPARPRPHGAEG